VIEIELDNVRTAWEYALTTEQFDVIGKSAEALALFCFIKAAHAELARIQFTVHDLSAAEISGQQAFALFQGLGTRFWQALPLTKLGDIATATQAYTIAIGYQHLALAL